MKTVVCIAAMMWLSSAVLLGQSSDSSSTKEEFSCAKPNPNFGYSSDVKLAKSGRVIKFYDVDYPESGKHDPICLSKSAHDTVFWVSSSGKRFKLKVGVEANQNPKCGQHPFVTNPPIGEVDGHYSGPVKPDVPNDCQYQVDFQMAAGQTDPHIRITP